MTGYDHEGIMHTRVSELTKSRKQKRALSRTKHAAQRTLLSTGTVFCEAETRMCSWVSGSEKNIPGIYQECEGGGSSIFMS